MERGELVIRVLHLFPDLLNLYGDRGNIIVLCDTLRKMGAKVELEHFNPGDIPSLDDKSLLYAGPGTEKNIKYANSILAPYSAEIKAASKRGIPMLFTGSAAMLACQELIYAGEAVKGLGLISSKAVETKTRQTGDIIYKCNGSEELLIGFINKSAFLTDVEIPLFKSEFGPGGILDDSGNETEFEGIMQDNTLISFVIGPMLVKNPWLRNRFAKKIFEYAMPGKNPLEPAKDYSDKAYEITLSELKKRI